MEFACHIWAFNHLPLSDALGTIARLGFRYVDLGSGPHLDVNQIAANPRGTAARIRQELELFNLRLSDIYLLLPRISLADAQQRQKDIDLFNAMLPFVIALEAPGVTLSPGLIHPAEDETAFDRSVAALRQMVSAARTATPATHLRVSIEPQVDSMAQTPQQAEKLLKEVPHLELTLDWAQLVYQNVDHATIAALLPHARHIQLRQAARKQLQTPFDGGRIDIDRVVQAIQQSGYSGVVSVEYMQTQGKSWHGMIEVDPIIEAARLRDALRDARDRKLTQSTG